MLSGKECECDVNFVFDCFGFTARCDDSGLVIGTASGTGVFLN